MAGVKAVTMPSKESAYEAAFTQTPGESLVAALDPKPTGLAVHAAISAVAEELSKVGISKSRQNQSQGYKFRGIDEVYGALAPLLPKHGLIVVPRILTRECVERTSKSGTAQFYVTVSAEFDFIAVADGSTVTARTYGEAQDSGDKATNKAMSAAYKYAAFQTFCIPTEGDNDADAHTPEPAEPSAPKGYADWLLDFEATAAHGYDALAAAFKAAPEPFRTHYQATVSPQAREALKAKARGAVAA